MLPSINLSFVESLSIFVFPIDVPFVPIVAFALNVFVFTSLHHTFESSPFQCIDNAVYLPNIFGNVCTSLSDILFDDGDILLYSPYTPVINIFYGVVVFTVVPSLSLYDNIDECLANDTYLPPLSAIDL